MKNILDSVEGERLEAKQLIKNGLFAWINTALRNDCDKNCLP